MVLHGRLWERRKQLHFKPCILSSGGIILHVDDFIVSFLENTAAQVPSIQSMPLNSMVYMLSTSPCTSYWHSSDFLSTPPLHIRFFPLLVRCWKFPGSNCFCIPKTSCLVSTASGQSSHSYSYTPIVENWSTSLERPSYILHLRPKSIKLALPSVTKQLISRPVLPIVQQWHRGQS